MKNQFNRMPAAFFITGLILLLMGCPPAPTDNAQNNVNTNQTNLNDASNNAENLNPTGGADQPCSSINQDKIKEEIKKLPPQIQKQFNDGTLNYVYADKKLTFKGYIYGNPNFLALFFQGFGRLRGSNCINAVSFQGQTPGTNFEWRPEQNPPPPAKPAETCDAQIKNVIDNSEIKDQIGKNFSFAYDKDKGVLELKGYIHEKVGKGALVSLFRGLDALMTSGCITKITFAPGSKETGTGFSDPGFEWTICEAGQCECAGMCVPCPCSENGDNQKTSSSEN